MRLTPRQLDVIVIIRNTRHVHGYSPTIREIATQLHLSRRNVFEHIGRLEKKGYIRRSPGRHRTLEVVADVPPQTPESAELFPAA